MLAVIASGGRFAINGHASMVQILIDAGADLSLQGSGAPGFEGKTA